MRRNLAPRPGPGEPVRVFLVDDSPLALVMLKRMLATSAEVEVVGTARSGREALAAFESARPHVVCTDYLMPDMDGLELIQRTMEEYPRPILVISSAVEGSTSQSAFPLLAAGAVDVFPKPSGTENFEDSAAALVKKVKIISGVSVISRRANRPARETPAREARNASVQLPPPGETAHKIAIVTIGASTGGPQVLQQLLGALPANFPCPILCVQHISTGFLSGLVEWLDSRSRVRVKIAERGEVPVSGTVYFPPEDCHMELDSKGRLVSTHGPSVDGHKPSVTVTFQSAAGYYGAATLGILLTGMGGDGAAGMETIVRAGGITLAQNEASCVVYGMPQQAIARGAAQFVLPPDQIARYLTRHLVTS